MSKDKQYRSFLKSKYNNEVMWTGNYYSTYKGAKDQAERRRVKEKFDSEMYTEVEVLIMETRIVTVEVPLNGD